MPIPNPVIITTVGKKIEIYELYLVALIFANTVLYPDTHSLYTPMATITLALLGES